MFASWKPIANGDGSNILLCKRPHTFDPVTAKTERPVACSQCRAQKVRCISARTGEGCRRCQTLRRKCTYSPRRSSTIRGEKTSSLAGPELRSGPSQILTPAPTEDSERPISSASTDDSGNEWRHEPQGSYSEAINFPNFPLDPELTRYHNFSLMEDHEVQGESEQVSETQEQYSLFRSPQNPEVDSNATPGLSPGTQPRLPQTETLLPSQTLRTPGCQCLHHVVILMDELELLGGPTNARLLVDDILVAHRKALRQAETTIACVSCVARVENMLILTFLVNRLTDLCGLAMSGLTSRRATEAPLPSEAPAAAIGAYRLEGEIEYIAVVQVLLRLNLDRLLGLVSTLQEVGRRLGSGMMDRRLSVCRRAIGTLLDGK
ncbi:hypothetical protein M426DRAFT_319040 [Hypoxylon sp. CI-4A]|nr:hypothetical protein M426DRAFT_319040 [Hypoxylon sp. CI-4A]